MANKFDLENGAIHKNLMKKGEIHNPIAKKLFADTTEHHKEESKEIKETSTQNKIDSDITKASGTQPQNTKTTKKGIDPNYTRHTLEIKLEYLHIIQGLAKLKGTPIKDILTQLLDKSIKSIDPSTIEKALNYKYDIDKSLF